MPLNVYFELFAEAQQKEAGYPDIISSFLGAFGEALEFPLTFGHLGVDAFVVDASVEAEVEVSVGDFASDPADVGKANTAVVFALRSWVSTFGEAERHTLLHEKVFLFKSKPSSFIVRNGSTTVG